MIIYSEGAQAKLSMEVATNEWPELISSTLKSLKEEQHFE